MHENGRAAAGAAGRSASRDKETVYEAYLAFMQTNPDLTRQAELLAWEHRDKSPVIIMNPSKTAPSVSMTPWSELDELQKFALHSQLLMASDGSGSISPEKEFLCLLYHYEADGHHSCSFIYVFSYGPGKKYGSIAYMDRRLIYRFIVVEATASDATAAFYSLTTGLDYLLLRCTGTTGGRIQVCVKQQVYIKSEGSLVRGKLFGKSAKN
jgi:hypothetical protein